MSSCIRGPDTTVEADASLVPDLRPPVDRRDVCARICRAGKDFSGCVCVWGVECAALDEPPSPTEARDAMIIALFSYVPIIYSTVAQVVSLLYCAHHHAVCCLSVYDQIKLGVSYR